MYPKKVTLTTFIRCPEDAPQMPPIKSLEIPNAAKKPHKKLICVYGKANVQAYLKDKIREASQENELFYRVQIKILPGKVPVSKVSLNDIADIYFLNLMRLNQEVAQKIYDIITSPKKRKTTQKIKIDTLLHLVSEKPHLLDKVWKHEDFNHLSAICWPVYISSQSLEVYQMVAVKIEDIDEIEIRGWEGDPQSLEIKP